MPLTQAKPIEEVTREPQFQPPGSQGKNIAEPARIKYLRVALQLVGVTFIFGIYALTIVWPSGWSWHHGHTPHYLQMILGVYATLGIFLLIASRKPLAHLSLIWFTVWSSVVHAAIMAAQSLANPEHLGHLWGDVLGLFLVAAVPCCSDATSCGSRTPNRQWSRHRFWRTTVWGERLKDFEEGRQL